MTNEHFFPEYIYIDFSYSIAHPVDINIVNYQLM
jgi:hypothetical protein